jgi:outer membrane protein assembly factor BamD (BamD/ComL family)
MNRRALAMGFVFAVLARPARAEGEGPHSRRAPPADPVEAGRADLDARHYDEAIAVLEPVRKALAEKEPRSARLAEVCYLEGEACYLSGDKYRAHTLYRTILETNRAFPRLADVISREYEIGTAFIDGKAERPVLGLFHVTSGTLGAEILTFLIDNFQEKYFDTAQYLVADFRFRDHDWRRAADAYLRVEEEFQGSQWVPSAMFQRALCYLHMSRGYRYDDTWIRKAETLLKDYARKFPRGDRIKEAEAKLQDIREDRAAFYLETADFYAFRERKPRAVLVYLEAILREGPDTPSAERVPALLARVQELGVSEEDPTSAARAREIAAELERKRSIAAPAAPPAPAAGEVRPPVRADGAPPPVRPAAPQLPGSPR